jgi:hypothetical protein
MNCVSCRGASLGRKSSELLLPPVRGPPRAVACPASRGLPSLPPAPTNRLAIELSDVGRALSASVQLVRAPGGDADRPIQAPSGSTI